MKKIILLLLLIFPIFTNAQDTGWVIDNFHSDVFIKKDGKLLVKEYVNVDFYNLQKHGIYRDIPILYKDEKNNKEILKIKPLSVSNLDETKVNEIIANRFPDCRDIANRLQFEFF